MELLKKIGPILEIDATKPPSEVFDNISDEITKYLH
jgi:thymidylate kinase